MQTHLEMELEQIKIKVFEMADLAIEAVTNSVNSLKNADIKLAQSVVDNDNTMDNMEILIDNECIKLLVTRQPAASDLRLVLSMLKINTDLERIGDLSSNIAKESIRLHGETLMKPLIDIPRMAEISVEMIRMSFDAITEKDASTAKSVIIMDDKIDALNLQIYRELFTYMGESTRKIAQCLGLIMIAKSLERIGDHAKNIAERAIYYIQGDDIRHKDIRDI